MNFQTDLCLYRRIGYPTPSRCFLDVEMTLSYEFATGLFQILVRVYITFLKLYIEIKVCYVRTCEFTFFMTILKLNRENDVTIGWHHFEWIFKLTYGYIEEQDIRLRPAAFSMLKWLTATSSLLGYFKYLLENISPF